MIDSVSRVFIGNSTNQIFCIQLINRFYLYSSYTKWFHYYLWIVLPNLCLNTIFFKSYAHGKMTNGLFHQIRINPAFLL